MWIYMTEHSFGAYSWQILEKKQNLISNLFSNKLLDRECKDIDDSVLTYAEVKALALGNEKIKEREEVFNKLSRLKLLRDNSIRTKEELKSRINYIETHKDKWNSEISNAIEDYNYIKDLSYEGIIDSTNDYKEVREELYNKIFSAVDKGIEEKVAEYRGFEIITPPVKFINPNNVFITLKRCGEYTLTIGFSSTGFITRINNFISSFSKHLATLTSKYDENMNKLKDYKRELAKNKDYDSEIDKLEEKLNALNKELKIELEGEENA